MCCAGRAWFGWAVASPAGLAAGVGQPVRGVGGGFGCRGSSGGTIGRLPVPSTSAQPDRVFRSWWWAHNGSSSSSRVCRVCAQGSRWSFSVRVRQHPCHGAAGTGPGQGDLLSRRWPTAEVSHVQHIHPAGDHQVQNRTPQQPFGHRHRHRADAADLAQLATGHPAAVQGLHIDPQQRQIPRIQPPRQPRRQQVSARLAGTPINPTTVDASHTPARRRARTIAAGPGPAGWSASAISASKA